MNQLMILNTYLGKLQVILFCILLRIDSKQPATHGVVVVVLFATLGGHPAHLEASKVVRITSRGPIATAGDAVIEIDRATATERERLALAYVNPHEESTVVDAGWTLIGEGGEGTERWAVYLPDSRSTSLRRA